MSRSLKVLKCWRDSSVVGTTTATCLPFIAAMKAARSATSVLPKPTSPQIEAIHRPAGGEIVEHGGNGGMLVVGLLVRKAGAELVVEAGVDRKPRRLVQLPLGGDLDQFAGDLADAVLHPRLARLPGGRAEAVELDAGLLRAVARQKLDVLDRQEQLVAAGVVDLQAIVRRAGGLDGAQADEAADAVIDMDDEIAGGEARHLGDEIFGALDSGGGCAPGARLKCLAR